MSDEQPIRLEPDIQYDESDVTEELDEQGRPVRVIHRARLVGISIVDPRTQHRDDNRTHKPEE